MSDHVSTGKYADLYAIFKQLLKQHGPESLPGLAKPEHIEHICERAFHKIGKAPKPEDMAEFLAADILKHGAAYRARVNCPPGHPSTWTAHEQLAYENAKAHKRESDCAKTRLPVFTPDELKAMDKMDASKRLALVNAKTAESPGAK